MISEDERRVLLREQKVQDNMVNQLIQQGFELTERLSPSEVNALFQEQARLREAGLTLAVAVIPEGNSYYAFKRIMGSYE